MSRVLNYYKVWFSMKLPDHPGRTQAWLIIIARSKQAVKAMAPEFLNNSPGRNMIILRIECFKHPHFYTEQL